jgi:hypothetical protein
MRAMHTPLVMIAVVVGIVFAYLLAASAIAALIALTLFLIRRSRLNRPLQT